MKASVIVEMGDGSVLSMSVLLRDGDLSLVRPGTPRSCCNRNADNQGCDCPASLQSEVGSVSLRGVLLSCETSFKSIRIASPGDDAPDVDHCQYCGTKLADPDDRAKTLDERGPVTLCERCYRKAGNRVR